MAHIFRSITFAARAYASASGGQLSKTLGTPRVPTEKSAREIESVTQRAFSVTNFHSDSAADAPSVQALLLKVSVTLAFARNAI
jgi:hypothetical protein